jgi:hypothetical protein
MDLGTIAGATGLESALNALWAANAALAAAVPADRLITGRVPPSEEMPYVRLEPEGGSESERTNASLYATERVSFHIWSDGIDAARAIARLIRDCFASNSFNWGSGAVLDMKWDGPPLSRQTSDPEIKAWQTTVSFTCSTWQQRVDTPAITSSSGD